MTRTCSVILVLAWLGAGSPARADDFAGAKIVDVAKGQITFEHEGKEQKLAIALSLKIIDDKGETHDPITGTRFLVKGNIVDIKTKADKRTKKETIVEIKFVSGTVGELPKAPKNANLKPDPDYKGNAIEALPPDAYWAKYLPTAKVGDFVEYKSGNDDNPGRQEVMEVGKDYVIVAKVSYILGHRSETRTKFKLQGSSGGKASSAGGKKPPSKGKETEEITVGDKKIKCEVEKTAGGKVSKWHSSEVPLDGLVKEESRNFKYTLVDFGHGSKE